MMSTPDAKQGRSEESKATWADAITVGATAVALTASAALTYGVASWATTKPDLSHNDFVTSLTGSEVVDDTDDQISGSGEVYDVLPTDIPSIPVFDESPRDNRFLNG